MEFLSLSISRTVKQSFTNLAAFECSSYLKLNYLTLPNKLAYQIEWFLSEMSGLKSYGLEGYCFKI